MTTSWSYITGNCTDVMNEHNEGQFRFIFADPPYNMGLQNTNDLQRPDGSYVNSVDDDWDDWNSQTDFINFNRKLFKSH